jgi:hypothetical protein
MPSIARCIAVIGPQVDGDIAMAGSMVHSLLLWSMSVIMGRLFAVDWDGVVVSGLRPGAFPLPRKILLVASIVKPSSKSISATSTSVVEISLISDGC